MSDHPNYPDWEQGPEEFWPDDQAEAELGPAPPYPPEWYEPWPHEPGPPPRDEDAPAEEGGEDQLDDDQADVDPWDPAVFPWRCAWGDIQRARFHPDSLLN